MKYYIGIKGKPAGPFSPEELLANGLEENTLVWNESMPDWGLAKEVPELAAALGIAAPAPEPVPTPSPSPAPEPEAVPEAEAAYAPVAPAVASGHQDIPEEHKPYANLEYGDHKSPQVPPVQPQQYVHQQYAQPQYAQPAQQPKYPMPEPVTNMWLSIASAVLSLFCCCNVISLILAVIGIVKANSANKSYKSGSFDLAEGDAKMARTMALCSVIILIVWPIVTLVLTTIFDPETQQAFFEIFEVFE